MQISYPTVEQVRTADAISVMCWNRFLPSPVNEEQVSAINAVVERLRSFSDTERVNASKVVGW